MLTGIRERYLMNQRKILTGIICLICLIAFSSITLAHPTTQPQPTGRGVLYYDPHAVDFGNVPEGTILNTTFQIWTAGGCCTLTYHFEFNYTYVTVYPMSGTSDG